MLRFLELFRMDSKWYIDINCDVGEGVGNEARIFPYISSCNIACGGHAGDAHSMEEVVGLAISYGIKIGAHPSYPDREHFGRQTLDMPEDDFRDTLREQLDALGGVLDKMGARMHHIKAHGALYNDLAQNPALAGVYLDCVASYKPRVRLLVPYGSVMATLARKAGFGILYEAFADRAYGDQYQLVPRGRPGALIEAPEAVAEHLIRMVKTQQVKTQAGALLPIRADTFCIHGDTPSALQILMYLAEDLPRHGIYLKK